MSTQRNWRTDLDRALARIRDEYHHARVLVRTKPGISATAPILNATRPRAVVPSSGKASRSSAAVGSEMGSPRIASNGIAHLVRTVRAKHVAAPPQLRVVPSQPRAVVPSSGYEARREAAARRAWISPSDPVDRMLRDLRALAQEPQTRTRMARVRDVVAAVPAELHAQLVARDSALLANLNGVPFALRMQACRTQINADFAAQQLRTSEARRAFESETSRNRVQQLAVRRRYSRARRTLSGLEALRAPFVSSDGASWERQFLAYVPETVMSSGRVVEVFGDLHSAHHVLIMVSGMNNSSSTFFSARNKLEQVVQLAMREHPNAQFAAIEWMGYDSPDYVRSLGSRPAVRGAAELRAFVDALELSAGAQLTIVGHSYGSLVVSEALRQGLGVHRAVFTGSPGVRAKHVDELLLPSESVFAAANDRDLVVRLKWHGTNPASAQFGAVQLATSGRRHAEYFVPDSGALTVRNVMHIALGQLDRLARLAHDAAITEMRTSSEGPALR
ncbi:MAG: alpha/beta hydrolase [Acidimicrobiia bacterium]